MEGKAVLSMVFGEHLDDLTDQSTALGQRYGRTAKLTGVLKTHTNHEAIEWQMMRSVEKCAVRVCVLTIAFSHVQRVGGRQASSSMLGLVCDWE